METNPKPNSNHWPFLYVQGSGCSLLGSLSNHDDDGNKNPKNLHIWQWKTVFLHALTFWSIMTLSNWKMIAERRSYIFRWRYRFRRLTARQKHCGLVTEPDASGGKRGGCKKKKRRRENSRLFSSLCFSGTDFKGGRVVCKGTPLREIFSFPKSLGNRSQKHSAKEYLNLENKKGVSKWGKIKFMDWSSLRPPLFPPNKKNSWIHFWRWKRNQYLLFEGCSNGSKQTLFSS